LLPAFGFFVSEPPFPELVLSVLGLEEAAAGLDGVLSVTTGFNDAIPLSDDVPSVAKA
jgi:hypothetical protein